MGIFIEIDVNTNPLTPDVSALIVSVCPVDIFTLDGAQLLVRPEQVDECTLCELCLDAAPAGALTIRKTYKDEKLVSRGPVPQASQGAKE